MIGELRVLAGAKDKFAMVDGHFAQARFCFPRGLCFDSKRRLLYVSDMTCDTDPPERVGVVRCLDLRAGGCCRCWTFSTCMIMLIGS
jgi:hypothetical protein